MNKLTRTLVSVMAVASLVAGFSAVVNAAPIADDAVAVAEVTKGAKITYNASESTETKKVLDIEMIGFNTVTSSETVITLSDISAVSSVTLSGDSRHGSGYAFSNGAFNDPSTPNGIKLTTYGVTSDAYFDGETSFAKMVINTTSDVSFDATITYQYISDENYDDYFNEVFDAAATKITVPKYVTDPEPEPKPEAQVVNAAMKHSQNDELSTENEAQYWLAEFTPTAAFNTLTVTAKDKAGNEKTASKTETMVSGGATMFVQVLVTNITNEMESVVVTASVE